MKKELSLVLGLVLLLQVFTCIACAESAERSGSDSETAEYKYQRYAAMTPEEIVTVLTLDQKAAQSRLSQVFPFSSPRMMRMGWDTVLTQYTILTILDWVLQMMRN